MLGALSAVLEYPPGYIATRLHLDALWGVPIHLLMLGALVGLHTRQAGYRGYGRLGTAGFSMAFVGGLLAFALGPLVFPEGRGDWSLSLVEMVVVGAVGVAAELGMLLLGVATVRAAVLPSPWRMLPLAIFVLGVPSRIPIGSLVPEGIGFLIFMYAQPLLLGIGWVLLGYALWSGIGEGVWRRVGVR